MKDLKEDITKLKTFANYAKLKDLTTARIYQLEKAGELKVVEIDGKKFIKID